MSDQKEKDGNTSAQDVPRRKKVLPLVVALVVCLIIAVGGVVFLVNQHRAAEAQSSLADPEPPEPAEERVVAEEPELPANPVDFGSIKADYPDVYAWINVPDTNVNYPIAQSLQDDNYYLRRDLDGTYSVYGTLFSQSMNSTDFTDPVTVIYGHNSIDGAMFGSLHKFEDADFFNAHDTFYIYTPGHILTYQIVAAYRYDDRHILNSFDFSDEAVRREYFDSVLNPTSMLVNVRAGVTLDTDDKLVQLSTCPTEGSQSGGRYLVTGVLVDDQQTR